MRSITSYVKAFQDHRTLPRVEMELVLSGKKIEFSPSCAEVTDMIISVVHEMNKLLREAPTIQSWLGGSSNQFVPVTLNKVELFENSHGELKLFPRFTISYLVRNSSIPILRILSKRHWQI